MTLSPEWGYNIYLWRQAPDFQKDSFESVKGCKRHMKQKKFSLLPYILSYKWYYLGGVIVLLLVDLANLYIPQ